MDFSFILKRRRPRVRKTTRTAREIQALGIPDPELSLSYVLDAIRLIQQELAGKVPLIGFVVVLDSCHLYGSGHNKSFPAIRHMMQEEPHLLHDLLNKLAEATTLHLNGKLKPGFKW